MSWTVYGKVTHNGLYISDQVDNNRDTVYFLKNDDAFININFRLP